MFGLPEVQRRWFWFDFASILSRVSTMQWLWMAIALISVAIGLLYVRSYGSITTTLTIIFVILFVGISILRPSISLYVFVFLGIAVEQAQLPYAWTLDIPYHQNLNSQFPSLRALSINPVELHLLCITAGVLLRRVVVRERWTPIIVGKPLLLYFCSIVFFVMLGLWRGGATLPALWEVRGIGYLMLLTVLVPQVVRTRDQVRNFIWACIAGVTFRALEVTTHFVMAGFSIEGTAGGFGSHEDAGMFATLLVLAITLWFLKVSDTKQRVVVSLASVLYVLAIIGAGRRSAYAIVIASLILLPLMLPRDVQKKVLRFLWKAGIVFGIYLAVFWNTTSENILLTPVQSIRQGFAGDDPAQAGERYLSNLFRKVENYDLHAMFRDRPLLGTGYGMLIDYRMPIPVGWELGFYIPHNQILSVPAKTGIVGLIIFLNFYLAVIASISAGFHRLRDDKYLQAVLVLVGVSVVCHLIFSYFDIILTYYRPNIFTGSLLGVASAVLALKTTESKPDVVQPPPIATYNQFVTPDRWLEGAKKTEPSTF
jgi:O-antigen ligase